MNTLLILLPLFFLVLSLRIKTLRNAFKSQNSKMILFEIIILTLTVLIALIIVYLVKQLNQ